MKLQLSDEQLREMVEQIRPRAGSNLTDAITLLRIVDDLIERRDRLRTALAAMARQLEQTTLEDTEAQQAWPDERAQLHRLADAVRAWAAQWPHGNITGAPASVMLSALAQLDATQTDQAG